jgi:hypothetical protein
MQTFLPYPDFARSAAALDDRRLNNQVNEALIILRTNTGWYERRGRRGWPRHPVVKMWAGHEKSLLEYATALLDERQRRRGGQFEWVRYLRFIAALEQQYPYWWRLSGPPLWLGDPDLHAQHRAVLVAKDAGWYGEVFGGGGE